MFNGRRCPHPTKSTSGKHSIFARVFAARTFPGNSDVDAGTCSLRSHADPMNIELASLPFTHQYISPNFLGILIFLNR